MPLAAEGAVVGANTTSKSFRLLDCTCLTSMSDLAPTSAISDPEEMEDGTNEVHGEYSVRKVYSSPTFLRYTRPIMGLFSFGKKTHAAVLVDIGSASVGGGILYSAEGTPPILCYSAREEIFLRKDETLEEATLRALSILCDGLATRGVATLHHMIGHAHLDTVLASVAAPWQDTQVSTVLIQEPHQFVFTRALMQKAVRATPPKAGRIVSDTSVIATSLNGYATDKPWGRRAHRADMTVLTSTIEASFARVITTTLRKAFHSHTIELTAFAPVAYAVVSDLYPLQKDFVVIDVSGTATDAIIVKQGVLVGVASIPQGIHQLLAAGKGAAKKSDILPTTDTGTDTAFGPKVEQAETVWLTDLKALLAKFATNNPLPHTVFLLADEQARDFLKNLIDRSTLRTLWLSENPLSVIALSPEHTAAKVSARGLAEGDVFLSMLALFYKERLT
jgi:hypothetical protein